MKITFKRNQPVRIQHGAGKFETGRIVRADHQLTGWYIVRFDVDGATLCVAASSLRVAS